MYLCESIYIYIINMYAYVQTRGTVYMCMYVSKYKHVCMYVCIMHGIFHDIFMKTRRSARPHRWASHDQLEQELSRCMHTYKDFRATLLFPYVIIHNYDFYTWFPKHWENARHTEINMRLGVPGRV